MNNMCLVVTPSIRTLADKIRQEYPEASTRNGFSDQMCAEWIGLYNNINSKSPDFIPSMKSIVNFIEKLRNKEGKSFLRDLEAEKEQYAIEQEMQDIKAKAIADGTFMKAPNGKPTNLTERQWLQVRTKNFINWFGDWEKYAPKSDATERLLSKLNNIANSDSKYAALAKLILDNKALPYNLKYFKIDNNRNDIEGHAAMWHSMVNLIEVLGNNVSEEEVNKALLHELIHYNTEELLTAYKNSPENVPQNIRQNVTELYSIIDYAKKYITEHFNEKKFREIAERQNKNIGSRVFYAFDNQGSVEIDEFISEIFTNPGLQEILNSIPYKETNQTLWDKIKECIHDIFGIPVNKGSVLEEALKASTEFITKAKKEYDSVSKVVDENGEPKVMLRIDDAGKSIMGRGDGGAFFATDKLQVAGSYDSGEAGLYKGFVNLKNPYIVKGESHGFFFEYKGKKTTVQNAQPSLMQDGYDGVYFERTWDVGDYADVEPDDDYWANNVAMFNPNQFKSATDNNGEFSTENDAIFASPQAYEEIPVEALGEIADEEEAATMYDSLPSSDAQLNEKFGNKTETTVSEMLNNLLKYNSPFSAFIKALQNNLGELGDINIKLVPNSYSTVHNLAGAYNTFDNTIYINRNVSFNGKDGKVDNTIIHELVHAIVANSLNTQKHREELNTIFEEAREKILKKYNVSSFEELPENLRRGRLYGLQNLDEFSAEFFTNSEFILELNDENTFGKRSDKKSIISKLVEWIKSLLPKGVTETYKRSGEILEDILLNSGGTIQSRDRRNLLSAGRNSATNTINQENNRLNNQIEYGNDFRRVQETSRKLVQEGKPTTYQRGDSILDDSTRSSLATTYARLLSQGNGAVLGQWVSLSGKGNQFKVAQVTGTVFHDIFEINRNYLKNGELVDLHDTYDNCKCYLTEDGLAGFAIEENGNLISVFSLNPAQKGGFLYAIKDHAIAEGATHLDAYNSSKQPLKLIYEKVFGAKVASSMDYNMEYDHDGIAANHGSPQVVFMVMGEAAKGKVTKKHFNKDQYDEAEAYQHSYLPQTSLASPQASTVRKELMGTSKQQSRSTVSTLFKQGIETLAGYYEGGGRLITNDFPGLTKELDDKLNNHFMEGEELSDADYYELNKYVGVIKNPDPNVVGAPYIAVPKGKMNKGSNQQQQGSVSSNTTATQQSVPQNNQQPPQGDTGSFGFTQEEMEAAAAERQKNLPETQPSIPRPLSPSYETALKAPTSEQKEFYNAFSPEQIVDRARMIASMFSDIIDDTIYERRDYYQSIIDDSTASEEDKNNAKRSLETYRDPVLARVAAVNFRTYSGIMQEIEDSLSDRAEYATDDITKQKLQNTIRYYNLLTNEASKWIEQEEGIRKGKNNSSEDEEQDDEDFGDNEEGNASNGNDGWSFKERFNNPFRALSKMVRRVLSGIETGENDDLGNSKTYSQGFIYSALMSYLSKNLESADDFMQLTREDDYEDDAEDVEGLPITKELYPHGYPRFPALEKMRTKYAWADQVILRLTKDWRVKDDEDGTQLKYPPTYGQIASQFYTNFRKAFIPYAKIQVGIDPSTGKPYFGTTPLNYDMEDRSQREELERSYNNGITYSPDSLYNNDKSLNIENAKKVGQAIDKMLEGDKIAYIYTAFNDNMTYDYPIDDEYIKQAEEILNIIRAFGINVDKNNVASLITQEENGEALKSMLSDLRGIAKQVEGLSEDKNYFLDVVNKYKRSVWDSFFEGRGFVTETNLMQSFYDSASKKTLYSYSADNYLQKTMRYLFSKNISKERRQQYLNEHFGVYEWFRDQSAPEGQGWKSLWLESAYNAENLSEVFPYTNINSIDIVNSDGTHDVHPYSNWDESDRYRVMLRSWDTNSGDFAYYLSPIFADSPMSMTVRGPKFSRNQLIEGTYDASGKYVPSGFIRLIDQELQRIKYIKETRAKAINEGRVLPISNYEKNGSKFCFMPELNEKMFGPDENLSFYDYIVQLTEEYDISQDKVAGSYNEIIRNAEIEAIQQVLQRKYWEFLYEMPQDVREEFAPNAERDAQGNITTAGMFDIFEIPYYNMVYAASQIVELTTVDTAFYKNSTDFQKRFKEVYASGTRLNTNSRFGKKFERVLLVADEQVTSRSYNNIKNVVENSSGRMTQKEKDYVLSCFSFLKGRQDGINVSDAQALRSLTSYRSILDMMGKWDERTEAAYHRIINHDFSVADFDLVLQTLKPFVYSVISKSDGADGNIPVPIQHKNSELVLLAMYDLICGSLKNSAKLRGINRFLEEVKDAEGNPIADMIQFESAGKSGNQGVININYSHKKVMDAVDEGEIRIIGNKGIIIDTVFLNDSGFKENTRSNSADNFDEIKTQLTQQLQKGKISQDTFNKCVDYFQPTEEEVMETLTTYATVKDGANNIVSINSERVQVVPYEDYMIAQPTPEHHMDAQAPQGSQGRNIIVADLPEGFKLALAGKGKDIRTMSKEEIINFYYDLITENLLQNFMELRKVFKDKKSLRDKVMQLASSSPTYGSDFAEAFSLDENGDFVLSPNSPTIFKKVQQLVNSVIKNNIAVQKVNGAALIQASGIGLSEELNLVFDKNGKPVGAECYLPATSRRFFETFMKKEKINGQWVDVLDIEALQRAKLDKAIGYRIPTENKSSMLPIIIKGFAPQQNGSCIFLPAEITVLSGSDFDVDKMFLMLSDFYVREYDMRRAREDFARTNSIFNDIIKGLIKGGNIAEDDWDDENIEELQTDAFKEWWKDNKDRYRLEKPEIHLVEYDFSKSPKENGRRARNTMLVQIMYKILTSQEGAENMFNPQHFEGVKEASKMMKIMQDRNLLNKYMEEKELDKDTVIDYLLNDSEESLIDFVKNNDAERSPIYPQTFNYFHQQNMAGDALLAMFALQVSAAAKFQRANITIKKKNRFTINGRTIQDVDKIFNGLGEHRLKNVSQFVGACADNGKDPNVTDFGATRRNAKMIAYLLRAGLSIKETALIINQPLMQLPVKQLKKMAGKRNEWQDSNISSETLAEAIMQPDEVTEEEQKAIAIMCIKIKEQSDALAELTSMSRADSPNGGIPETFAKARLYKYKVDMFNGTQYTYDFPFEPIEEAISNSKVNLKGSEDEIRAQIQAERMSMLQGFYSLGVQSFDTLLSPFFFMLDEEFDNKVTKRILNQLPKNMSDDTKVSILEALYNDFITYSLSGFSLFGDENSEATMKGKREYYLREFPNEFNRILAAYPEIRDAIGNVLTNYNGRIVLMNGGQLIKGQREEIMRRIAGLRYMRDTETQKAADKLAKDLFIYSFFDNGLQFTKDSFSTMFSTQFCTGFEGYNEFLQELGDDLSQKNIDRFILQFFNNHPEIAFNAKYKTYDSDTISEVEITINRHHNHNFDNPMDSGVRPYNFITYDGILYRITHFDDDFIVYHPLTRFDNSKVLYNKNKTQEEMADDYTYISQASEGPMSLDDWMAEQAFMAEANQEYNNALDTKEPLNSQTTETPTTDNGPTQEAEQDNNDKYMSQGEQQLGVVPC